MDPNFIQTGEDLSKWRTKNHYTIKALSEAIGYDPTYISHVETKRYENERGEEIHYPVPKKLKNAVCKLHNQNNNTTWAPFRNFNEVIDYSSICFASGEIIEQELTKLFLVEHPERSPHKTECYLKLLADLFTYLNKFKELSDSNTRITEEDIKKIYNEMIDLTILYYKNTALLKNQ